MKRGSVSWWRTSVVLWKRAPRSTPPVTRLLLLISNDVCFVYPSDLLHPPPPGTRLPIPPARHASPPLLYPPASLTILSPPAGRVEERRCLPLPPPASRLQPRTVPISPPASQSPSETPLSRLRASRLSFRLSPRHQERQTRQLVRSSGLAATAAWLRAHVPGVPPRCWRACSSIHMQVVMRGRGIGTAERVGQHTRTRSHRSSMAARISAAAWRSDS